MAITILNNLYPPLVRDSYAPAFIYNQSCKIYFELSKYNSLNQLAAEVPVQVTVRDIKTNRTVLSSDLYPSGIKLCNIIQEETSLGQDPQYYIQINSSDIQGGFKLNEYYQVQLRLTGHDAAAAPATGIGIDNWLSENLAYFSQWSTIVLIYGISTPTLNLKYYKKKINNQNTESSAKAIVAGTITFDNAEDKETLKSYRIFVKDGSDIVEDSGLIYPNDYNSRNELFYSIKYNIQKNKDYRIQILMETKNLYSFEEYFIYRWNPSSASQFDINYKVIADDENGGLRVRLTNKYVQQDSDIIYTYESDTDTVIGKTLYLAITNHRTADFKSAYLKDESKLFLINYGFPLSDLFNGVKLTIKRACSRNNFNTWDDIAELTIEESFVFQLIWDDYTVEPGVWYKYKIIRFDQQENVTSELQTDPQMVYTDHIFLTSDDKQLTIAFNPQISNFSIKTADSVIETIGSQYPYIRRMGNIYYKTFALSGTISFLSDINRNLFHSSKNELYLNQDIAQLYENYNRENNIGLYNDFVRQKEFRNAVMDFLYKDDIKLFRSLTEGNMLVKLTNIVLTPNTQLGRMIYSFSCNVYETVDPEITNIFNYDTQLTKKYEIKK